MGFKDKLKGLFAEETGRGDETKKAGQGQSAEDPARVSAELKAASVLVGEESETQAGNAGSAIEAATRNQEVMKTNEKSENAGGFLRSTLDMYDNVGRILQKLYQTEYGLKEEAKKDPYNYLYAKNFMDTVGNLATISKPDLENMRKTRQFTLFEMEKGMNAMQREVDSFTDEELRDPSVRELVTKMKDMESRLDLSIHNQERAIEEIGQALERRQEVQGALEKMKAEKK